MSKRDIIRKCIAVVVAIAMTLVMMQVNGREIVAWAEDSSNEGSIDKYIDTIELTMDEPEASPKIITQPDNQWIYYGESATFSIEASGDNLTYQWQVDKNGNGFENCTNNDNDCVEYNIEYTGEQSNTLKISSEYSYTMSGWKYRCVVTNSVGSVKSDSATLRVEYYTPTVYMIELDIGTGGTVQDIGCAYGYNNYIYANMGDEPTLSIIPNEGYEIDSLYVDENLVEIDNRKQFDYAFGPIYENHKLKVTFREINNTQSIYKIKLDIGKGGTLTFNTNYNTDTKTTTVYVGDDVTFGLHPSDGYIMESLIIDGNPVELTNVYTFTNVRADHTLKATYKKISQESETKPTPEPTEPDNEPETKPTPKPTEPDNEPETKPTPKPTEPETETETEAKVYDILDGADSKWTYNASSDNEEGLSIRGAGLYANFKNIKVDGEIVDKSNYTVREGSTIITLKPDYLESISDGNHSFEMIWTDGHATTEFTVDKSNDNKDDSKDNNNNTDDSDNDSNTGDSNNKDNNTADTNNKGKNAEDSGNNKVTAADKTSNNQTDDTANSTITQEPVIKPDKVSTDNKNVKSADSNKNSTIIAPQTSDTRNTSAIIYLTLLITSFVTALIARFKKN